MGVRIVIGDMTQRLRELENNSVDSVVCDPPYHLTSIVKRFSKSDLSREPAMRSNLHDKFKGDIKAGQYARLAKGFMGQQWDGGDVAFRPETWAEVWRVLKPGGHLAAFSGTRTYHRMACAIEDAGFEVREMLSWNFGSGFPKSKNVIKDLEKSGLACHCHKTKVSNHYVSEESLRDLREGLAAANALSDNTEQDLRSNLQGAPDKQDKDRPEDGPAPNLHNLREPILQSAEGPEKGCERKTILQPPLLGTDPSGTHEDNFAAGIGSSAPQAGHETRAKSGMEGRRDAEEAEGKLQRSPLCEGSGLGVADGAEGSLHNGTSASDGADVRLPADANGSRKPQGSQPGEQSSVEPGAVADKRGSQAWGGWPVCGGCSKPIIPEGLGSALKPAHEPICLARKPLSEKSIAANVLKWGTGAINIDGCRIEGVKPQVTQGINGSATSFNVAKERRLSGDPNEGRWPANLCHDGSEEVLAGFPDSDGAVGAFRDPKGSMGYGGSNRSGGDYRPRQPDSGSAARFFYCAKASKLDRLGSDHPTVKPVELMRWLVRLVTPSGGLVLDPFAGSGSTGIAAFVEGFDALLVELRDEAAADAQRRIDFIQGMGQLRALEMARLDDDKRKAARGDDLPLFGAA
jgi:DNA modification methylase